MNENKIFPEVGNDVNNEVTSNPSITPVEETVEVPTETVVETPVVEVPTEVVETPVVEPTLDFPVVEEVPATPEVVETPAVEIEVPTLEVPAMETVETPVMEEVKPVETVEAPVAETPVVEMPTMEVPTVENVEVQAEPTLNVPVMEEVTPVESVETPVVEAPAVEVTPVEPVIPVAETPALVENVTPVMPSGDAPKKNMALPIIVALIAVALIGFGVWFLFFRGASPKKLSTQAFDKFKGNVVELTDLFDEIKTYDKGTESGELTVDFSSAYLASEDYEGYESVVELLDAMLVKYDMGVDLTEENAYLDAILEFDKEEMFDLGFVAQDGKYYFHVLDKYVDVTDQIMEDMEGDTEQVEALLAELEGVDGWYFYDLVSKAFAKAIEGEELEKENTTITVDKKEVKVVKNELRLTKGNAHRFANTILDVVKNDAKFKKIAEILEIDMSELKFTKEDFEYMTPISINFYSKGSELVKIELYVEEEYEWDDEVEKYETIMSYTFGEKTDVIEMIAKENGETYTDISIEFTVTDNSAKIELFEDGTKLGTVELKVSGESLSLTFNADVDGENVTASVNMNTKVDGTKFNSTVEVAASIDTVEYFRVKVNNKGTFEEKYDKVDLKDAVHYDDLTYSENEEISDYLDEIEDNFNSIFGSDDDYYYDDEDYYY